mmetsp:Transcript_12058/g.34856  ORF Transcript_12058/g.34856 Transcript_12058/m.34856 type:complete len:230 (+) Transcript_12058:227-916(+)
MFHFHAPIESSKLAGVGLLRSPGAHQVKFPTLLHCFLALWPARRLVEQDALLLLCVLFLPRPRFTSAEALDLLPSGLTHRGGEGKGHGFVGAEGEKGFASLVRDHHHRNVNVQTPPARLDSQPADGCLRVGNDDHGGVGVFAILSFLDELAFPTGYDHGLSSDSISVPQLAARELRVGSHHRDGCARDPGSKICDEELVAVTRRCRKPAAFHHSLDDLLVVWSARLAQI